ncbi:MAG: ATP-dependent protease ATPase subunit HslU [Cytophagales bacterium]|nr:ATP-dependent protease ATPase subunit HslU [Cytophagales bacterium]
MKEHLTPKQIVEELDKYVIGQKDAKKNVAIALRNRWRRMNAPEELRKEIMPNNILMIGATGVGKTEIARRLAKLADAPFIKVEASKFTEVGYVGRDVESMVRDLVAQAIHMVKTQKKEAVIEQAKEQAELVILDALIPPMTGGASDDVELNNRTRERFLEKLKDGELEDKKVEIEVDSPKPNVNIIGGPNGGDEMEGLQDMLGNMMPKKINKRKLAIKDARKILVEQEASKLIDMEEVKDIAIKKSEDAGIIFIDEIDKIATSNQNSGEVSREGVQRDLLPIVEGSTVNTRYGTINTNHILFISAGAFHVSKPSDLIPELQGRFPIRVELSKLTKDDFYQILKTPRNALTKQYEALLASEEVEISFSDDALERIAEIAYDVNNEIENIGARRLNTLVSKLLNEILFDVPDVIGANAKIVITKEKVNEQLGGLVKDKDLTQYIL